MVCVSPISIKDPRQSRGSVRITVPCGKCGSCRHNRRVDWSFRLKHEFRAAKTAFFLTLTYSDENIRYDEKDRPSLVKRDLQLFNKRIRKASGRLCEDQYRYYAVGEYGSRTHRPHYHLLVFNLALDVVNRLSEYWTLGHCHIGAISDASIHYMTKYHVNYRRDMEDEDRVPEFAMMSRKPGIGASYLTDDVKKYHTNGDNVSVVNNGYVQRMPRYYREKIFSKEFLEIAGENMRSYMETEHEKEYNRLLALGITDPDTYIQNSRYIDSQKVLDKAKGQDRL